MLTRFAPVIAAFLIAQGNAQAQSVEAMQCIAAAAEKYQLDPVFLLAIAEQESQFNPLAYNGNNANKSADHGMMQINSAWLPALAKFHIRVEDLYKPCVAADVGAWILLGTIQQHGYTVKALGAYNASSPAKQLAYASKVMRRVRRIQANPQLLHLDPLPATAVAGLTEEAAQ